MLRRRNLPLGLPDLDAGGYLVEAMLRLGPMRSDGMGERQADWPEIDAFARLTGRITEAWEAELLHDMCAAYTQERSQGENPLTIPPVDRGQ